MTDWRAAHHRFDIRVYYEDTDFTGMVYHSNIVNFLERGRTEFFRDMGVHHAALQSEGYHFVVRNLTVNYHVGARIDDLVQVRSVLRSATGARLEIEQAIFRADTRLTTAAVTVGFVNRAGKPRRLTADISAKAAPILLRNGSE